MRGLGRRFVWFLQNTRYCQIAHRLNNNYDNIADDIYRTPLVGEF